MRTEIIEAKMRSWANMMKERLDSGLTIEEWCEVNGLNIKQFEYNGLVKLTSENGIIDKRTNQIHTEVICNANMTKYFGEITVKSLKRM